MPTFKDVERVSAISHKNHLVRERSCFGIKISVVLYQDLPKKYPMVSDLPVIKHILNCRHWFRSYFFFYDIKVKYICNVKMTGTVEILIFSYDTYKSQHMPGFAEKSLPKFYSGE